MISLVSSDLYEAGFLRIFAQSTTPGLQGKAYLMKPNIENLEMSCLMTAQQGGE